MFKNYTINQTTLPLDVEHYIPETDVAFEVHSLVETIPQALFNLTWRIGAILKNKTLTFAQRIVRYRSKIIVAEKIKVALFEISKSMNVRIVGTVQFVVNVRV
ncbi:hypothetical protein IGJ18_002623 [Enterococcus sp. AZ078]